MTYKRGDTMNMKRIYRQVAKEYGVSVEEVKRDMTEATNAAYITPNFNAKCVPSKGDVPTTEEMIRHIANRI